MALDFGALTRDVTAMPTVPAGLVLVSGRIRNELEAFVANEDLEGIAELLREWDANAAVLADAVVESTPAQKGHEGRAAWVQDGMPTS